MRLQDSWTLTFWYLGTHIRKSDVILVLAIRIQYPPSRRFQAVEYDGRFFVNPGSATGAWIGSYNGCVLACLHSVLV